MQEKRIIDEKRDVERETEAALAAFDTVQRAAANPFFYTRLKARLQAKERSRKTNRIPARLVLAVCGVLVLIALNVFSMLEYSSKKSEVQKQQVLASLADEYGLSYSRY
jgi:hypothetical protein